MDSIGLSQGVHGSGKRDYTDPQYHAVIEALRELGKEDSTTVKQIADRSGVPGRTVRSIISEADGVDVLLGGDGNGYRLALDCAGASRLTARMLSQIARMTERVQRRERYLKAFL